MKNFENHRIYQMPFSKIYPLYIQKIERKGRKQEELDHVIAWLTGYSIEQVSVLGSKEITLADFFDQAPHMNEKASFITGIICGVRVEEIDHPLMQKIRYMDKIVDELAKGRPLEKIFRN